MAVLITDLTVGMSLRSGQRTVTVVSTTLDASGQIPVLVDTEIGLQYVLVGLDVLFLPSALDVDQLFYHDVNGFLTTDPAYALTVGEAAVFKILAKRTGEAFRRAVPGP